MAKVIDGGWLESEDKSEVIVGTFTQEKKKSDAQNALDERLDEKEAEKNAD